MSALGLKVLQTILMSGCWDSSITQYLCFGLEECWSYIEFIIIIALSSYLSTAAKFTCGSITHDEKGFNVYFDVSKANDTEHVN